jgi:Fe-S oxidoreductase
METHSNPWGIGADKRTDWAEGLDVPLISERPNAEYLYYVGCAGAFDDRAKKTTIALVKLLKKAGVDFAILGNDEPCNGDTARRLGNEYLYQTMAQTAIEIFNAHNVKKIITNCPHCFNTFKNEYPQFGGTYEVIPAAELIEQLVAAGRLTIRQPLRKKVTYHDSCNYGRYNNIYDSPRAVLATATGGPPQEMERSRHAGMCCGAGGGRMWIDEDPDQRVNVLRVEQALETQPEIVAVSCPFCMTMLSDGIKHKSLEDEVEVLDVAEIFEEAMR